jgi:hypothetical protein
MIFTVDRMNQINLLREELNKIEKEVVDRAREVSENLTHGIGMPDAIDYGRLLEAVDNVGEALFNMLNVAGSYAKADEPLAHKWIHLKNWRERA